MSGIEMPKSEVFDQRDSYEFIACLKFGKRSET